MSLKTSIFLLSFAILVLSCGPDKKGTQENKKVKVDDTIHNSAVLVKDSDTLTENVKTPIVDTTAVLKAFKKNIKTDQFIKELGMDSYASVFDSERPILIGDLNGDHLDDAIMPFSIEGRGGGNNWDANYAIFINNAGTLEYQYSFARGGDLAERQINFNSIKDGVIQGMEVPGFHSDLGESNPVEYIYRSKELSELLRASEKK